MQHEGGEIAESEKALTSHEQDEKTKQDLEESSSVARDLHLMTRQVNAYKEQGAAAELMKATPENKLIGAKMRVKQLTSLLEESIGNTKAQRKNLEKWMESSVLSGGENMSSEYLDLMRELEFLKNEIYKIKLNISSVQEERSCAEQELNLVNLRTQTNMQSAEALRQEVDTCNEEHILVELARIEALKELGEIEAQRHKTAAENSVMIEERKNKIKEIYVEIEDAKQLEKKLSETQSDVNMLEQQLELVKNMEKRVKKSDSLGRSQSNFSYEDELEHSRMMLTVQDELEMKKNELASAKQEGFMLMAFIDTLRQELSRLTEEIAQLSKAEEKTELKLQNLNAKVLRSKSKLDSVSAAERNSRSIAENMYLTLEQLKEDIGSTKNEKKVINEDIEHTNAKTHETQTEIDLIEERLMDALEELEAVKASEALALHTLESVIKNTVKTRASAAENHSTITISKFEYEYLVRQAFWAKEIAEKKIESAHAWTNALKASEKEILLKVEAAEKKGTEGNSEEEEETNITKRRISATDMVKKELSKYGLEQETRLEAKKSSSAVRKLIKGNGRFTPSPHVNFRKSYSPGAAAGAAPTTCFVIKKKRVVPRLVRLFGGER